MVIVLHAQRDTLTVAMKDDIDCLRIDVQKYTQAINELNKWVVLLEQTCKTQAQATGSKGKHDDPDHENHEGEKRQKLDDAGDSEPVLVHD